MPLKPRRRNHRATTHRSRRSREHLRAFYSPACRDVAPDDRRDLARIARLQTAPDFGPADGRFPDDPGNNALSRRERGRDGFLHHDSARTAVRPDQRTGLDEFDELVWNIDDHAPIRPRPP